MKLQNYELESGHLLGVRGNLKNNLGFWRSIGAPVFILSMIENVYKLLFVPFPLPVKLRSNTSARLHVDFVDQAVLELVNSGRMRMVNEEPLVVNLLSVSIQPRGKKRLILDLRDVNNSYLSKVLSTRTGKLLWLILRKTRTCFHGGSLIPSNKYFMFNFHCAPARSFLCLLFFHKGFEAFRKYWRKKRVLLSTERNRYGNPPNYWTG